MVGFHYHLIAWGNVYLCLKNKFLIKNTSKQAFLGITLCYAAPFGNEPRDGLWLGYSKYGY